jgi:uncharacterized protein YegL
VPESPGGPLATRPLQFFWVADCSGSMAADGKIQALNNAIRETIPHLRDIALDNPFAQLTARALAFSSGVRWHIEEPTPIETLQWVDLVPSGLTDLGAALEELATQLGSPPLPQRSLPPAIVLISDGQPTDDFEAGLDALLRQPWGRRSVRVSVAIGRDADLDVLTRFASDPDLGPLTANNPEQLAQMIRWASTIASQLASEPGRLAPETIEVVPVPRAAAIDDGEALW